MIEIGLNSADDFLKIKETLSRIGIASIKDKTLYQSCHILHKRGKYYIVHFLEMFGLDGRPFNMNVDDTARLHTIVNLLLDWKLCYLIDSSLLNTDIVDISKIKILKHSEKQDWKLQTKYNIGTYKIN